MADVGLVVNPAGVEAQLMGGTVDGLSTAIGLEITVKDGRIEQSNFDGYPLLRMPDAPSVETYVLPSTMQPSGAGEMGIPSAAPALANAILRRDRQAPAQSPTEEFLTVDSASVKDRGRNLRLKTVLECAPCLASPHIPVSRLRSAAAEPRRLCHQPELGNFGWRPHGGVVRVSYEYPEFHQPDAQRRAGHEDCAGALLGWGYDDVEPIPGQTRQCSNMEGANCDLWTVTREYQCTSSEGALASNLRAAK